MLCEKFKCLPSELDKQDVRTLDIFLQIIFEQGEFDYKQVKKQSKKYDR